MIESINNFAGFNLSAILGGTFAGIFFLLVFHYLLMPILSPFIIKPFAGMIAFLINSFESMIDNIFELFSSKKNISSNAKEEKKKEEKKETFFERLINWFSNFFVIKAIFFLCIPFMIIIYLFEASEQGINAASFDEKLIQDIIWGSIIFFAVVLIFSFLAKSMKFEFKKTFPIVFIVSFALGIIGYFK